MTVKLDTYLALERAALLLDRWSDPFAEATRDVMDGVWWALNEDERAGLDAREEAAMRLRTELPHEPGSKWETKEGIEPKP